jgi:hypothetical protein
MSFVSRLAPSAERTAPMSSANTAACSSARITAAIAIWLVSVRGAGGAGCSSRPLVDVALDPPQAERGRVAEAL